MIEKKYLSTKEAAEYLGVSMSTIYSYTRNRIIPHYKPGGNCFFLIKELDEFMKKNRVKTMEEIKRDALKHYHRIKL